MLTHAQIWAAIDALAARQGFSVSNLAKQAGLDSTTFNRSKRFNTGGHPRWPSTESLAKILAATGVAVDDFMQLVKANGEWPSRAMPMMSLDHLDGHSFDNAGAPQGARWESMNFPIIEGGAAYALEIQGQSYSPVYQDGDRVIVAPKAVPRRGDRIVVHELDGAISLAVLGRQTATHVTLGTLTGLSERSVALSQIRLLSRIVWASQ